MRALLALLLLASAASAQTFPVPLDHPEALARFFRKLAHPEPETRVRITHLGDSHTAADLFTGTLRRALQGRFGDGGRGFVLAGRAFRSYIQSELSTGSSGPWRVDGFGKEGFDDGFQGLSGISLASLDPAQSRVEVRPGQRTGRPFTTAEVHFLRQPAGGCLTLQADEGPTSRVDTRGPWLEAGFARVEAPAGALKLSLKSCGTGEVRLLGVSLDRAEGVVYDALGINGARADRWLRVAPALLTDELNHLETDLVVLAFGSNELYDSGLALGRYTQDLKRLVGRLRLARPEMDCLLVGPPDILGPNRETPAQSDALIAAQRAVAAEQGCAFFDTRAAMGGEGAMRTWMSRGLAQRDGVHLTRGGYEAWGEALLGALIQGGRPYGLTER